MNTQALTAAFEKAIDQASHYLGQTSPNPCVGAAALDGAGNIIAVTAHERAGEAHAEAKLITDLKQSGQLASAQVLVVTLEPCNHFGRTPPCTEAILQAGFKKIYYGALDPNPRVEGHGAEKLRNSGLSVFGPEELLRLDPNSRTPARCKELIQSFAHWSKTGRPWVTLKTAFNIDGTMFPPPGTKTFTSPDSLRLAHSLRKRADAILTGSGTILADQPLFTVRHVPDHPGKSRWLAVLDRRGRISDSFITQAKQNGFQVYIGHEINETLQFLGQKGVLEVLVEAGPILTQALIDGDFWNQHVIIRSRLQSRESPVPPVLNDQIEIRFRS